MKKIFFVAVLTVTIFGFQFLTISNVFAQTDGLDTVQEVSGLSDTSLPELIGNIINVLLSILGVIFLVLIIYAGYTWMTAGGEAEKVDKAKKIMLNAVVGLVITLASYAITSFIINAITGGDNSSSSSSSSSVSVESLSGSLGSGALRSHYPERNATDVSRNTKIYVTFKSAMNIESFITGYDTNGTLEDVSDDITATALNVDNIVIYKTEDGESEALSSDDISVSFTDDLQTFVFDPPILGSSMEDVSYTVYLNDKIESSDEETVLDSGGYEWSFEVGTEIDLDPPTVKSVIPAEGGEYDRNITVQITFDEAIDPTSATGTRESDSGFDNIQTYGEDGVPVAGVYEISNNYTTITFTSSDACGTNSCGETIYCLPASQVVGVNVYAATPGTEPPQVDDYPYDGIVDTSGNALDGDDDGTAGDDYTWTFNTTNDVNLDAPKISLITPDIKESNIDLDQKVYITFDSAMLSSTLTSDNISLEANPDHELWYSISNTSLNSSGEEASGDEETSATMTTIKHGVFLSSSSEEGGTTYLYAVDVTSDIENEYQNCFVPSEGPDESGGSCGTTESQPYCCNGVSSSSECSLF